MRHLIGIALAVVMVAVLFFAGAWGYLRLLRLPAPPVPSSGLPAGGGSLLSNGAVLTALAAMAGTAVLAGILVGVPRISPLAAGLPGLLLIAWTGLYMASGRRAVALIPLKYQAFGAGFEAMLFDGVLAVAGLAMIVPVFVPSRWRAREHPSESAAAEAEVSEFVPSLGEAAEPAGAGEPEPMTQSLPARPPLPVRRPLHARRPAQAQPPWAAQPAPWPPPAP
ncbi:MAG: hypothetical protein JOY82_07045 [Streptosporangiaceae bacterium]|nr:hypothetical protein [Streptosporangiaceae bacterium]